MATMDIQPPHQLPTKSAFFTHTATGPSPPETYANHGMYAPNQHMSHTPPSISPTSVFGGARPAVPQLRQPRTPLQGYIPACLRPENARPTDIPNRLRTPDTPPASKDSSFASETSLSGSSTSDTAVTFAKQDEILDIVSLRKNLSRQASESLEHELGEVTGKPTDAHWKPNSSALSCAVCRTSFTLFFRRHHCRKCGDIVCDTHSLHRVPLDQNARYHPKGHLERACDPCWAEMKIIKRLRHSRASSITDSTSSDGTTGPGLAIPGQRRGQEDDLRVGSMAHSEGMMWSTF